MENRHSLRALHTFEAVSRHMSVAGAAKELGVTQSAVSHQLRLLCDMIGERLIQKDGRGITLTKAGRELARRLQSAFSEIDRSVADVIGGTRDIVRLAVCSSFAPAWLVPRLQGFYALHPTIDLQILMYAQDPELTDAVGDAFVTTLPSDRGYNALFLFAEQLVPVVSTERLKSAPAPINRITTDLKIGALGKDWHDHARLSGGEPLPVGARWLYASHYVIALDMVRQGLGAAMLPSFLVEAELTAGTLSLIDDTIVATHEDYYLCIKESRRKETALDAVSRWFKAELERTKAERPQTKLSLVKR